MKRTIFSNKNYFIAIILFIGMNNLNTRKGDLIQSALCQAVSVIVTPSENGVAQFRESLLLQEHSNPLYSRNIRVMDLTL